MDYLDLDISRLLNFKENMIVDIIDSETKEIVRGSIKNIISNSNQKNKGIKVFLKSGNKGRIVGIPDKSDIEREKFKFYNMFFNSDTIYTLWNTKAGSFYIAEHNDIKVIYLFSNEEFINESLKSEKLKGISKRTVKRGRHIVELFKKYNIDFFIVNNKNKISNEKMKELEDYYTSF